jgi:hypothetical protein
LESLDRCEPSATKPRSFKLHAAVWSVDAVHNPTQQATERGRLPSATGGAQARGLRQRNRRLCRDVDHGEFHLLG